MDRTLIIGDATLCLALRDQLLADGVPATVVAEVRGGVQQAEIASYDVVVLVGADGKDDDVRAIRALQRGTDAGVLAVLAEPDVTARAALLQAGADACPSMLLSEREIAAYVHELLKHRPLGNAKREDEAGRLAVDDLILDRNKGTVHRGEHRVRLTRMQALLLEELMRNARQVVERAELARHLGPSTAGTRKVDVHVCRLRKKLRPLEGEAPLIVTVPRAGYMLRNTGEVT